METVKIIAVQILFFDLLFKFDKYIKKKKKNLLLEFIM